MAMWPRIAHHILDHPRWTVIATVVVTLFLGYWALQVKTDHTGVHFLAPDSKAVQNFERAGEVFGKSQSMLYLVFDDVDPYDRAFLASLDVFVDTISAYEGVASVLSLTNVPFLVRENKRIASYPLYTPHLPADALRTRIDSQPFLSGFLLSQDGTATAVMVNIDEAFNDTPARVDLVERIHRTARTLPGTVALAGVPQLRSEYAQRISREAPLFTLWALALSLVFLFVTFRSWQAVLLPTLIVLLGITWTIGLIAFFDHRLNVVTAVLPALLVIIGMANSIHLSTKFYDQYRRLNDRREALVETICTVGLATLLTCLTTAIGFGVLVLSGSSLLSVFGQFAAVGIMLLYALSVTLIPQAFTVHRTSKEDASPLATHALLTRFFDRMATATQRHPRAVLSVAVAVTVVGVVGVTKISTDIYVFSDFYEEDPLRRDLAVFEEHFGGVLPLEVVIESKKPGRLRSLGTMRRLDRLQQELDALPAVGQSLSAADLVKLANQAYFGGNPATFRLPSPHELPFLQTALGDFVQQDREHDLVDNIPPLVDSTFSMTRVYLGVLDIGTNRMNALADTARARAAMLFPGDQFNVFVTGTAIRATRSGEHLVGNLLISLAVALVIISGLMVVLFRSLRLMFISLVPNVLPLLLVGGAMGFSGIVLKPSTALIFPVAFGIAVDSSIHFLTKFRLLRDRGLTLEAAIRTTLRQTGKAILFTSLVLMSGFLVFTFSSFGGTANMGFLTALTLCVALVANLVLLPTLLHHFGPEEHAPTTSKNGTWTNGLLSPTITEPDADNAPQVEPLTREGA